MKFINKTVEKEIWINLVRDFTSFGSVIFHIVALAFILVLDFSIFIKYAVTVSLTIILILLLKSIVFMNRPRKKNKYKTYIGKIEKNSLLSGHTASSFAFAISIGLNTSTAILIFLLAFATLVGISRVILKRHYVKNIVNGGLVGIIVGLIINLLVF